MGAYMLYSTFIDNAVPLCSPVGSSSFNLGSCYALSYVSRSYYKRRENQLVKCVLNTVLVISLFCLQRWKAQFIQNVT